MDPDTLEIVKEIAKANTEAVYKDAAQPSIRVVGKSIAQCVSLFATPVGRMAEIFEKNIHRYLDKLDGLNEEDIISPDTRILVPILEKLRFIEEEKVAEYYAEILAVASKKDTKDKTMLTFIEILNRLTADEINILEFINSPKNIVELPKMNEQEASSYGIPVDTKFVGISGSLPVINIKQEQEGKKGYIIIIKNFNILKEKIELLSEDSIDFYIDNLVSLGLIEQKYNFEFAIDKIYSHLEEHETITRIKEMAKKDGNTKINFVRGRIDITNLGKKLLSIGARVGLK